MEKQEYKKDKIKEAIKDIQKLKDKIEKVILVIRK